jgi:hypothetical protein
MRVTLIVLSCGLQGVAASASLSSTLASSSAAAGCRVGESGSYVVADLRTRCHAAEQRLKAVEGDLAIAVSKQKAAAAREEFLLGELKEAAGKLLCEWSTSPRSLLARRGCRPNFSFVSGQIFGLTPRGSTSGLCSSITQ